MESLLERIKPELKDGFNLKVGNGDELFLQEIYKFGDLKISDAIRISEYFDVDIMGLKDCFIYRVISINEVVSVDYSNDEENQEILFECEIEIGAKIYTVICEGVAHMNINVLKSGDNDLLNDCDIELEVIKEVSFEIYDTKGIAVPMFNLGFSTKDAKKILIDWCS